LSKERQRPLSPSPLRFLPLLLATLALLVGVGVLREVAPADARVFSVAIVDPASPGFHNDDFNLADAVVFPLTPSDGRVGIGPFNFDTFFAPVGSTVWLGIAVDEGAGDVTVDSNDYGTFTKALCNDNNGDGQDFNDPSDSCKDTSGMATDHLVIPDALNSLDHQPPAAFSRMGLGVAFQCQANPGTALVTVGQGTFTFQFFIVCTAPLAQARISATATQLEITPQPGSTAHSLLRLDLTDALGGIVAGYEVDWSVDRCGIETGAVDNVGPQPENLNEAFNVLNGITPIAGTEGPDADSPQLDSARNLVGDFNNAGLLESISLAIVHCEPGHSPTNMPGPIHVKAHISKAGEPSLDVTFLMNLVGPPSAITLSASPTRVECGEKVVVTAAVTDAIGQPVSDLTPVEFVVNLGGTGTSGKLAGLVAPVSSGVGVTYGGVATFFLLTSDVHVGEYNVVAQSQTQFNLAPAVATTSVSCFNPSPTPAPAQAAAAPTAAAPAAATTVRPPNTGDGGLR